nr:hypothetical protein [uncultured Rhodopila sp.]
MKKPKRRRPASGRKSIRLPRLVAAPGPSAGEAEDGDRLAALLRARLALMPPQVAADYRALAERDHPTVAEKARLSVLEDTYAPSAAQVQAAIAAVHAERGAQSRRRPAADRQSGAGPSGT